MLHADRARPKRLLAEAMPYDRVLAIDRRLAGLGRGLGAMRLWLGEGLARLEGCGGVKALGFPTLGSHAQEALGQSGRQAGDARALARRLARLPGARAALVEGRLSWSKVELVARVATPEDEGEWVARAEAMTVRRLRLTVAEAGAGADDDDEGAEPRTTLTITVDRVDAMAFEQARMMVQAVGALGVDGAVEAMLAEGLGELVARVPDLDLPAGIGGAADEWRAWREELRRMRREGEEVCEARGFEGEGEVEANTVDEPVWPDDVGGIDRVLRGLAGEIAGRDLELGQLARLMFESDGWRRLGYGYFEQYVRERVGLSASSVAAKVALARKVSGLPEVAAAIAERRVGFTAAGLVARVAGPKTAAAWVARAMERTVRHLREEVEAVELLARVEGRDVTEIEPPEEALVEEVHDVERAVIATLTDTVQMSVSRGEADGVDDGDEGDDSLQMSVSRDDLPTRTLRLTVSEDTARFWRSLERVHAGIWTGRSFVAFLARAVANAWAGAFDRNAAGGEYADVYGRDRWRCRAPACERRNVTPHHVRFRSAGGGEERGNLLSLCDKCHLELVHGGALRVVGDAGVGGVLRWDAMGFAVRGRRRVGVEGG